MPSDAQRRVDHIYAIQGGHREEDRLLNIQIVGSRRGPGGTNVGYECDLDDGAKAYFKPMNGINVPIAAGFGQTPVSAVLHEVLAWHLAREIGGPVEELAAPCVLRLIPDLDKNAPGAFIAYRGDLLPANFDPYAADRIGADAGAFFDSLIGQQDRNAGNIRWDAVEQRMHLIDQGYSFARRRDPILESPLVVLRAVVEDPELTQWEVEAIESLLQSADLYGLRGGLENDRADALERRARLMLAPTILTPGSF